jgi:hypothetical protein
MTEVAMPAFRAICANADNATLERIRRKVVFVITSLASPGRCQISHLLADTGTIVSELSRINYHYISIRCSLISLSGALCSI